MRTLLLALCVALLAVSASAQDPATGFPPFGSFQPGGFDAINRQNLNANFAIPIVHTPGRGLDFSFSVVYDSLLWRKVNNAWSSVTDANGNATWGWKKDTPAGLVKYKWNVVYCRWFDEEIGMWQREFTLHYYDYTYTDIAGTVHRFNIEWFGEATHCGYDPVGPYGAYANDGIGIYLDADTGEAMFPNGKEFASSILKDTNGNFASAVYVNESETDWKDSANHIALKIKRFTDHTEYVYFDNAGIEQTIRLNLQTYSIRTNFGCSGVVEYTGSASLPHEIVLPNGRKYCFTYEPTPGFTGYYTGRVLRVTLPTEGYYEYQYPATPNNGINCADATVTNLTRVINDGTSSATWQFVRAQNGSNWTTTVTAPQLPYDSGSNQSVYTFNSSGQQLSAQFYQGASGGTAVRTVNTSWAVNGTPASQTVILEDGQKQALTETSYDSFGNLLQVKEHDWGTGAPGAVTRTTTFTYTTIGYILDRVSQKVVQDGSGAIKFRQEIVYDQTVPDPCPTGVAQHDDVNFGCYFGARGNPTSITTYTDPATPAGGITKTFSYDVFGNLRRADVDCCQQEQWNYSDGTKYAYPDSVVRGPSGGTQLTTSFAYNSFTGLLTSATDANTKTTSFEYDTLKRLTKVIRPDGTELTTSYDDTFLKVTVTTPIQGSNAIKQITDHDGLGRPIKATVSDGGGTSYSIVQTQYDPLGRPYKVSNPHNSTAQYWTETRFDALGRPLTTILPGGAQGTISYSGNCATATDPASKQRKSCSDGLGRLAQVYEPDVNAGNALTQQSSYSYTMLDALASVNQGVQTRTYNYDGLGRLTSATTPEAGTFNFQYNSFGLVTQRTDARGVVTTYGYDTLNRLRQVSYNVGSTGVPATPTVALNYDEGGQAANAMGRLTSMTDGVGSESYTYDPNMPWVTRAQKVISGTTYTTSYGYNLAGEVSSITYASGRAVQQNYDAIGRLNTISNGATNYLTIPPANYNPAGQVTGLTYGNGVTAGFGYSADRLQLTSLAYTKGAQTLLGLSYGYTQNGGNNGQVTSITDNVDSGRSVTYTYDALYRLKTAVTNGSAQYPQWGLSWTYDRYGNRLAQTVTAGSGPSNSVTVNPANNRITDPGYSYDANGNMTNDGLNQLAYDAENRLVTSSGSTYSYDGNSLRVKKLSGGTTTVYVFSGTKVIAEYVNGAAPGSPTREYIYAGGEMLAKIEGAATKYYHRDHLSARVITDANGATVEQSGHFPFGESWYQTGSSKWKFTSYERDAESGNDYAVLRYHVNRLGRFSSPDQLAGSIADPQSLNRYAYVGNDPVNLMDPTGLDPRIMERYAFEAPNGSLTLMGFDQFDAAKYGMELWWAQYYGTDVDCSGIGFGCEGLWYDFSTGGWGFDLGNPALFYRWEVTVQEKGKSKPREYTTFSFAEAASVATFWESVFDLRRAERRAWENKLAQLEKAGVLGMLGTADSKGVYNPGPKTASAVAAKLQGLGNFISGSLYKLHAAEVGGCGPNACVDLRSRTGSLGPGSLHVVINTQTGLIVAHIDRWNPYQGFQSFLHGSEVVGGIFTRGAWQLTRPWR